MKIELRFNGYWREPNIGGIPNDSGIYLVYRSVFHVESKSVTLLELIYIGQAEKARERIRSHEKWSQFRSLLHTGEEIAFAFAVCDDDDVLDRAEAALIYQCQPPLNNQLTEEFILPPTTIVATGRCALLDHKFTVP